MEICLGRNMVIFDDGWDLRLAYVMSRLFDCTWGDSPPCSVGVVLVDVVD